MLRILGKTIATGIVTEPAPNSDQAAYEQLGIEVRRHIGKRFGGSLAIRAVDAGSCNACELEIHALGNPYYDVERFGIHFVASPRHADVLLVTGPVSKHMQAALLRTWEATPAPKYLIAAGDCACHGGEYGDSYATCQGVENVLPVDAKIPGCPPEPINLLRGLLACFTPASATK